jgi:hypothetical protein
MPSPTAERPAPLAPVPQELTPAGASIETAAQSYHVCPATSDDIPLLAEMRTLAFKRYQNCMWLPGRLGRR